MTWYPKGYGSQPGWYKPPVASGGYQGPGDVTPGAQWWGGLRAYNNAYATGTNPAVDLVDQANLNRVTINILSTGYLDIAAVNTWKTANSVTTVKVTRIYDQVGTSGAGYMEQPVLAAMPTLLLGSVAGLNAARPAMVFATAAGTFMQTGLPPTVATNQPLTISTVMNRTTTQTGSRAGVVMLNGGSVRFGFEMNTNAYYFFAGVGLNDVGTSANNTWYGVQAFFNGASSLANVNGVNTGTNDPGTTGWSGGIAIGTTSGGDFHDGYILEIGVWSGSVGAIGANQQTAWGY